MSIRIRRTRTRTRPSSAQAGFTLIEILVVILLISILAAIAIPMFLRQRDNGYVAQVRSSLRGAVSAAEAAALAANGDYGSLDQNVAALYAQGFTPTEGVVVGIAADSDSFCIAVHHQSLSSDNEWNTGGYNSSTGAAAPGAAICPAAGLLAALPPGDAAEDSGLGGDSTHVAAEPGPDEASTDSGDSTGTTDPSTPTGGTTTTPPSQGGKVKKPK